MLVKNSNIKLFSFSVITVFILTYIENVQCGTVFRLSCGLNIPIVGLGTHGLNGDKLETILTAAFDAGIRHIDTGFNYQNEETIGRALKKWFDKGGKREDIFITTKLPYFGNRPTEVEKYIKLSLEKLGLEYVDMYLIHAPFGIIRKPDSYDLAAKDDGSIILDFQTDPIAVWKEMENQVEAGRTKCIGLSNFNETQIMDILKQAKIKPSDLEIEVHAYHQQKSLRQFCQKNGIIVTAYAPLDSPGARPFLQPNKSKDEFPSLFTHPIIMEIAKNHGKSTAQILLRHTIQGGAVVIPSSKNPKHLKANLEIFDFELTEDEMKQIDALDKGENGKVFDYKFLKGIEKHPYYPFVNAS